MSQIREQRSEVRGQTSVVSGQRSEISGHIQEIPRREVADPSSFRAGGSYEPEAVLGSPILSVALLTGGDDKSYALGLASALVAQGISIDFIGSDKVAAADLHTTPLVNFLNLRGDQREIVATERAVKVRLLPIAGGFQDVVANVAERLAQIEAGLGEMADESRRERAVLAVTV